ncbi:MAG TPA: hypothetical protein VNW48_03245, partial [Xanthobacteraceae bacterium]|nr:hypothetical protein [Xanthobacteraceae bacterium]
MKAFGLVRAPAGLARIARLEADTSRAMIFPPGSRWRAAECSRAETSSLALPLKLAAAGSKPGRCHETPLRRLANFESMARTAPIRGSCSHRYFAIFFFFFFCVAMAISFSSGSYGRVEFKLC